MAMHVSLGKGEPIANDNIGTSAGELRLDEAAVLRLENLAVRREIVGDQALAVGQPEVANEGAVGPRARPFAEKMRNPCHTQILVCLAKEP